MKYVSHTLFCLLFGGLPTILLAGSDEPRTLPRVDAIYNEIMSTLTPDQRESIDSSAGAAQRQAPLTGPVDTANRIRTFQESGEIEKLRHIEDLPDDIRRQVEKTMQEMEQRHRERQLEFKELKRGR